MRNRKMRRADHLVHPMHDPHLPQPDRHRSPPAGEPRFQCGTRWAAVSAFQVCVKARLILALVVPLIWAGCDPLAGSGSRRGTAIISDVSQTNRLVLSSGYTGKTGSDWSKFISLRVYGQIDGVAHIFPENCETTKLSGKVEWTFSRDWYGTNCVLHYIPDGARKGHLTVEYIID